MVWMTQIAVFCGVFENGLNLGFRADVLVPGEVNVALAELHHGCFGHLSSGFSRAVGNENDPLPLFILRLIHCGDPL